MGDGIDEAARAFEAEVKAESRPAPRKGAQENGPPTEKLFRNIGETEVDDESPQRGGGDDDDPEEALYKEAKRDSKRDRESEPDDESDDADDDDGEGPEEAEEDSEEPDEQFLKQEVKVTVDGEERVVKLKEALEGYVRTETFHKRLNELDEAKKIVQRAAADAVQNYHYTMELGKQIEAHLDALVPKEPDWDIEFEKNSMRARELQKYYDQVRGFRAGMRKQLEEATARQVESDQVQLQTFAESETRKFDQANSRNWATDPKRKGKDLQAMRRTALGLGFTEDEISQVYDSRMLMVLLKASKFDRMMASKPQPVAKTTKPIAPGAGSVKQRTAQRGVSSAMKRLNKTGSIDDAAIVMDEIIRRGG